MQNKTEGEKLLALSRKEAWQLAHQLRLMSHRLRAISNSVERLTHGRWWEADTIRADFMTYCETTAKLCTNHAYRIDTHDRFVIKELQQLARAVRENDY